MKRKTITAMIVALASSGALASDFVDTAQVVAATPIVERVSEPRQECFTEAADAPQKPKERSVVAPILGGIAGALLGRQVGHGNGQNVATAVGAAVGTMAGDAVANPDANRSYTGAAVGAVTGGLLGSQIGYGRGNAATTAAGTIAGTMIGDRAGAKTAASGQPAQHCRTVQSTREVVRGYHVVYRYNGRDAAVTLPYDPGNTVKVGVSVIDEDRAADAGRDTYRGTRPVGAADAGRPANNANYNYRY